MPALYPVYADAKAGSRIMSGVMALDGSNPTSIETPFATITGYAVGLAVSTAPGDNTSGVSAIINGTSLDVYGWKATSGTDPTLVASTGTENFSYIIIGF